MTKEISFFVAGLPAPGGSKRGFFNAKIKRVLIVESNQVLNRNWRASVSQAAAEAMNGAELYQTSLSLHITFLLPRPKGHFGKKGLLPSAPASHIKKPDLQKLTRSTEDALTGVVWRDDAQVVHANITKRYTTGATGASIEISEISL